MSRAPARSIPRATYRLQLHAGFDFDAAARVVPYLATLGVSHVYSSPILQAEKGSMHGYDVVDHGAISEELGGEPGFDRLVASLRAHEMGLVVDLVPNHMAIAGSANRWWWDVLEHGPASRYADFFDVDWDPPESRLRNVILLPVLEDHYGRVLERGQISLVRDGGRISVAYGERHYPLDPQSLGVLVAEAGARSRNAELSFLGRALGELPSSTSSDPADLGRRRDDAAVLAERLTVVATQRAVGPALDAALAARSADPDALDALLEQQNYRLALWRASTRDLGYRRFFDVNTLIGLRVEREEVFVATHRLILEHVAAGDIAGLRIDHPDGLRDPAAYFARLRESAPDAWIVAEKILEPGEKLREDWPIDGTTGYRFTNLATGLQVDPAGEKPMTRLWRTIGDGSAWPETAHDARIEAIRTVLGSDLNRLTDLLLNVCEANRRYRDFTRHELHEALRELVAAYGVYRSYVQGGGEVVPEDREIIEAAVARAAERRPDLDAELFALLAAIARLELPGRLATELAMRLQQLTPAAMAKGVEDTAFYRYLRLTALNEVGGDPGHFGISPAAVHAELAAGARTWPNAMLTTSTHDTKRSEDVRARLALLSEIPDAWATAVDQIAALGRRHASAAGPDAAMTYLFLQTAVGAWPIDAARMADYLDKASREADLETSWTVPKPDYDAAVGAYVEGCLADRRFRRAVERFTAPLIEPGRVNALAQLLLKLTGPGVPDIYQGTDLWDLSLVDPDNRRPVDWSARAALLDWLADQSPESIQQRSDDGAPKLWTARQALELRQRRPELLAGDAGYRPLRATGPAAVHCFAYLRGASVMVVVPRLPLRLKRAGGWRATELSVPRGAWRNLLTGDDLTGGRLRVGKLLRRFPVALLERVG